MHTPLRQFLFPGALLASAASFLLSPTDGRAQATAADFSNAVHELIIKLPAFTPLLKIDRDHVQIAHDQINAVLNQFGDFQVTPVFSGNLPAELSGFVLVRFTSTSAQLSDAFSQLARVPEVEYVQLNNVFRLDAAFSLTSPVPKDSLFAQQWALQTLHAPEAWEITAGSPNVLIAVIDTGIELDHPDLAPNLWVNPGEDVNQNGLFDSVDVNGADDDGNGFMDDVIGWDFTDAPGFPDGGDYRERDNDPSDENGHGTSVAGIIAAVADNRIGVAGLAPNCRVMALRAGTSGGLLEEDDVASAIVYAVMNGARVINMSFGDVVVSPMLRDVIRFAHSRGAVLVASAGNSASDLPHYPSGFAETISVGATLRDGRLAFFSNFGATLDVVAPGAEIWTTQIGRTYATFSGTSAAAPFVSALAGLMLSRSPEWNNEMVRAALQNSATDLGEPGWDHIFGAGRIDAAAALRMEQVLRCEIHFPSMNAGFAENRVVIRGTVLGAFLQEYEIAYGQGNSPLEWTTISTTAGRQVLADSLGSWSLQILPPGIYTLRLLARQPGGPAVEDKIRIFIDRTPPVIENVKQSEMIDGSHHSVLIEFETDDPSQAILWWRWREAVAPFQALSLNYFTGSHRFNFTQTLATGELEFYLAATNGAGLETIDDNGGRLYSLVLDQPEVNRAIFVEIPFAPEVQPPAGHLLRHASDFDHDGAGELILSPYDANSAIGKIIAFERTADGFTPQVITPHAVIPRDFGDSDGDGKDEILAGLGARSFIYEAAVPGVFPTELVWADTTSNFWASRFADLDGDGRIEIIGRREDTFVMLENSGDNTYDEIAALKNFTARSNLTGVPHAEIGDFDGDGRNEILLGDYDGDLYIYETERDGGFQSTWSDSLPLIDSIDFIRAGDFDGDGRMDFAAGCHSSPELNAEHEFDARHWLFRIYRASGNDRFEVAWEQRFFGFQSPRDFDAGLGAGDVDGDGRDELFLNLFPDGYMIEFDGSRFEVTWHYQPARSNTTVVAALQPEQTPAFYFSDGEMFRGFQSPGQSTGAPAPLDFEARPLDASSVLLTWRAVPEAEGYAIFRAAQDSSARLLAFATGTNYIDTELQTERAYRYAVATLNSQQQPAIGPRSRERSARPSAAPRVVSATFFSPRHVAVTFNEAMDESIRQPDHFRLQRLNEITIANSPTIVTPESVVLSRSGSEVILTFSQVEFKAGEYEIIVSGAQDIDRVPLDSTAARARFHVEGQKPAFYVSSAHLESPQSVLLRFNLPVEKESGNKIENYTLETGQQFMPQPSLASASVLENDLSAVRLQLGKGIIAPLGRSFLIKISGVRSAEGIALERGEGDVIGFVLASESLDHVSVYPNPFIASRHEALTIAGLTPEATIKILDEQGRLRVSLQENDGNGGYVWDTRDEHGQLLPSGVYVCHVDSGVQTAWAKFVIVR